MKLQNFLSFSTFGLMLQVIHLWEMLLLLHSPIRVKT